MKTHPGLPSLLCVGAGLALAAVGYSALSSQDAQRHSRNPFAVQRSAYGKLLARLSETTIDRVWHLGVEQIVPHYMSGKPHHHPASIKTPKTAPTAPHDSLPPLKAGKHWINERVVAQHTRTNEVGVSKAHHLAICRDIEEMLLRSFKLDPTHYGAYDSYHLFLTTYDFGGNPMAVEQAKRIALAAIASAEAETEDPEPWLTAAAAAMNLYLMDATPYTVKDEPLPLELLKHYHDKVGHCLERFAAIQAESERLGIWENLSTERQMEIAGRHLFAKRTFAQFEPLIARAEKRQAGEDAPATPEVAGTEKEKAE